MRSINGFRKLDEKISLFSKRVLIYSFRNANISCHQKAINISTLA